MRATCPGRDGHLPKYSLPVGMTSTEAEISGWKRQPATVSKPYSLAAQGQPKPRGTPSSITMVTDKMHGVLGPSVEDRLGGSVWVVSHLYYLVVWDGLETLY